MFIRPADGEHVAMASPMTVVTDNFADLPRRHYGVIVADPPWSFASWTDKGKTRAATTRQKGIAGRAYATMTPAEIPSCRWRRSPRRTPCCSCGPSQPSCPRLSS